jgi:hypothetical protein
MKTSCTYCFLGSTTAFYHTVWCTFDWCSGFALIMCFNVRKWGRMTGRKVKMEKWVGTDGQGLYRVELHYNRIDRRRRHTLSHNLGLQSSPKYIFHSSTWTSFSPNDVFQFIRNIYVKLPGTQNMVYARHRHLLMSVMNVSSSTTRAPMRHVT